MQEVIRRGAKVVLHRKIFEEDFQADFIDKKHHPKLRCLQILHEEDEQLESYYNGLVESELVEHNKALQIFMEQMRNGSYSVTMTQICNGFLEM
jgi:hypothetical protein